MKIHHILIHQNEINQTFLNRNPLINGYFLQS